MSQHTHRNRRGHASTHSLAFGVQPGQPGQPGQPVQPGQPGQPWLFGMPGSASISVPPGAFGFWPSAQPGPMAGMQPGQMPQLAQPGQLAGQSGQRAQPGLVGLAAQPGGTTYVPQIKHGRHESMARPAPGPAGKRQRFQSMSVTAQPGQPWQPALAMGMANPLGQPGQVQPGQPGQVLHGQPSMGVSPVHPAIRSIKENSPDRDAPSSTPAPTPISPFAQPAWLDSPSRGHFPHASLSFPLASPLTPPKRTHGARESIAFGPSPISNGAISPGPNGASSIGASPNGSSGGTSPLAPIPQRRLLQPTGHTRASSIAKQRVGPPPKAILGGPGGKTFDELKVSPSPLRSASLEVSPNPSRRSSFGAISNASVGEVGSPLRTVHSPLRATSPAVSTAGAGAEDSVEIKHMGNMVRITLPPEKYSPPDSPIELKDDGDVSVGADAADASADGDKLLPGSSPSPSRSPSPSPHRPRKEAFPWPAREPPSQSRPASTSLLSPTASDLDTVETTLTADASDENADTDENADENGDKSPAKAARRAVGSAEDPSLVPLWTGGDVVVSVPQQKLVPIVETEHEEKTEDIGKDETAEMEKDADADADTVSEVSAPSMSWATAADESMTTTFTAQQEPWPPTRSGTPDSGARFSPIEEDHDRENENNNDGDSEKENADEKKVEKEKEDFNDSGSDTDTTADTATARSAPLTSSNATSPPKDKAGRYSPSRPASPDSVPTSIPVSAPSAPSRAPRRSVDVNPFLKRSLGGMLRERDAGKRSVRASADLSAQPVPEAGSPSALHEILTGDEADEEDNAADAPDSERDVAKVEAAEAAPEAEAPTPNPKEAAVPEPAPEPVTEPMTEPAAETLPAPPSEPRRPTVAVGAFSRQLQGFLRGDVAAFTPSAPAPKRGREDDDGDRKRDAIDATPARQSPPSLPSTLVNPSPAPTLVTATDATMEATEAPVDAPAPAAAADDDRAPPIEDPTATKRLKPAAAAFVPKPTATAFVPRPTAPSFAPRLRPQAAPFQLKHRAQTSSISGLRPAAAPFVPGGVPSVPSGGMLFGAPQPEPEKPSVLPEKQQDKQEQEHQHQRGNSLGLFTFTAKLRPTAPAFKPLTEIGADYEPGVGHAAEPLPAPEALVEPAVAAASLDSPVDIKTNGDDHAEPDPEPEVTRRHSFKESLDMQRKRAFHDSGSVDHGRRHSFRASTASIDMQPWRTEASPRGDRDRERERGHAVSEVEEVLEDSYGNAAARESSRHRRKRTSRRASQNSYLSQDMTVKSTPVSPVKTTGGGIAGSPTAIVRSRPIRHDAMPASASASLSVDMWSPPNALGSISERLGSLPMPTSADEFSPIAPVPSDIDDIDPTPGDAFPPATASGGFSFGKLNPAAEPFVFGGKVEPALASAPATFSTFAAQAREPAPAPAAAAPAPDHDVPSPTPTPPGRTEQIELAKETKFRKWTFPSGPAVSPPPPEALQPQSESASSAPADAPIPSPAGFVSPAAEMHGLGGDEESASEDDVEDVEWRTWRRGSGPATPSAPASSTSTEFPMRPTPPRVLAVVNGTSNDTSANGGSGSGDALLLSPQPQIAVGNIEVGGVSDLRAAQEDGSVLHVLHGIQRQLALLSVENEGKAHDSERRLAKAELHTTVTTEALDLIKEYIPKQGALDGIAAALQTQGAQLAEIQRRLEEEAHESGDKTLVEAPTTAMLKAVLSSQTAMMDKFAELADAHESLYSLRDATDALLAAHADVRSLRTDREHDVLQAQTLADVQRHLQEEGARTRAAETEVAMLRAQRDEAEREHEREKERAERQVAALKAAVEEAGAAKEAARAEAEKGTEELAAEREASQALKAQLVEAQVAATVSPMAEDELAALKAELATAKATVADGARAAADEAAALKTQIASATQRAEAAERSASEVVLRAQLEDATVRAEERERDAAWREQLSRDVAATSASLAAVVQSEGAARAELAGVHTLLAQQGEEHTAVMDQLRAERDAMAMLAEERHAEASRAQAEAAGLNKRVVERFDVFEGILRAEKERAAASEAETAALRRDLAKASATATDLRIQLTQARSEVALAAEQSLRADQEHATAKRSLDVQLKGQTARTSFLENKGTKLEAQLAESQRDLGVWRSAALEQRLRAEQAAVQIAALQQENLHWREFALGADRHRLEAWLATKPFHDPSKDVSKTAAAAVPAAGGKDTVTPAHALVAPSTPSATPSPSPARRAPTDYASQGSPLKHFVAADSD